MKLPMMVLAVFLWVLSGLFAAPTPEGIERSSRSEMVEIRFPSPFSDAESVAGLVVVLFGAFCALWAQNTGRNPWLWFFLGTFFNFVTIFFLLTKNANDIQSRKIRDAFKSKEV